MPTGYTAKLIKDGQTFPEFIMGCARAFGALIDMRDAPNDAAIPEKFEPSKFHTEHLVEATDELNRLQSMNGSEKEAFGQSEKDAAVKHSAESLEQCRAERLRLDEMAAQARAWNPPTPDHRELKDFMLQQLDVSNPGVEYSERCLIDARKKPAMAYYVGAVSRAASSITYHTKENAEEIVRVAGRSEWVRQLRASIGDTAGVSND